MMNRLEWIRLALILIAFTSARQVRAETSGLIGPPISKSDTHWIASEPLNIKATNPANDQPRRVRIGLRLTPFKKIITRQQGGHVESRFIQSEALRHTLRARINETNHFYVGNWHIETVPQKWIRKIKRYEVELRIFERYGDYGQLEESIGKVRIAGTLEEQDRNTDVLVGVAKQRLRDRSGNPLLDVVAGYQPGEPMQPNLSLGQPEDSRAARR
jgi:hypothetical protein